MTEIRFYHLQQDSTAKSVADILGKAVEKGMRVLLKLPNEERVRFYDDWLWRFAPESFLPHGRDGDSHPDSQPIWISSGDDPPNNATMVLVAEESDLPPLGKFALVCLVFDNDNHDRLQKARALWGKLKQEPDLTLTYWKQKGNGSWEKQNI